MECVLFTMPHNIPNTHVQNFAPMNFNQLQQKIFENYEAGEVSDDELVQIDKITFIIDNEW